MEKGNKMKQLEVKLRLSHAKVQGVNYLRSMVRDKSDISYRKRGYVAFVPNLLVRMLDVCHSNPTSSSSAAGDYEVSSDLKFQHGIVFFADISGFTKLTEKLAAQPNGAELLCAELDKVYALILSEVDKWGGDCIKFAGDAILFCWPVDSMQGTPEYDAEYKACAIRAVKCSLLIHESVKKHPEVAGVKLTLHAGMGCGRLAVCLLGGGGKPKRRYEFVIAGEPMSQIAKSEPAAKPGETVISKEIVALVNELVVGEEITEGPAKGYWKLRSMKPEGSVTPEMQALIDTPPPQSLTVQTLEALDEKLLHRLAMFIPEYILKMLDDHTRVSHPPPERKKSLDTIGEEANNVEEEISPEQIHEQLQLSSKSLSEMREATTLFVKLFGVDLSGPIDSSQAVFRCIQDAVYAYGGSINKLLVDDKGTLVLIVFGLPPLVHQDSATRAIAAAFLMLKLLRRVSKKQKLPGFKLKSRRSKASYINFRNNSSEKTAHSVDEHSSYISQTNFEDIIAHIGITSARTFCGTIGSEDRREFTVMGDSVNLAARLMAACSQIERHDGFDRSVVTCAEVVKPVEEEDKDMTDIINAAIADAEAEAELTHVDTWRPLVLVDRATAEASARSVHFNKFDPISVKGKSKPVSIFHPTYFFDSNNGIINHDPVNTSLVPKNSEEDKYGEGSQKIIETMNSVVAKIAMNDQLKDSRFSSEQSFDFAQENDEEGRPVHPPTVMVISGEQGNGIHSIARSLVDICPLHNVVLACSTPSTTTHNLLEEGEVKLATVFTAVRGPLLSILKTLINSGLIPNYDKPSVNLDDNGPISPGQFMLSSKAMSFMSKATCADYTSEVNVFRVVRILLPNARKEDIALLTHVFPEVHDVDEGVTEENEDEDMDEPPLEAQLDEELKSPELHQKDIQKAFSLDDEGVGSAAVDIATKGILKNNMDRLCGLLVALITKCIEIGLTPSSSGSSVPALSDPEIYSPPFQFLLLFEYAHLDPLSWEVINDLMAIGANRRIASPLVLQTKMSSEGSPSRGSHPHATVRPLLCLVTRPLVGTSASVEYLEMIEEATAAGTMIHVKPLSYADMVLMLRHCIGKHIWKMRSKPSVTGSATHPSTMLSFQIDSDHVEDLDAEEKQTLEENVRSFYTVFDHLKVLDGVSLNDIVESIVIEKELADFTWHYTKGCPSEVKGMSDNYFVEKMIAFSFTNLNSTDDEQEDFKFNITVSLHQSESLHVMRLSQFLRMSAISRFHSALDEKPAAWSQIARLASCFHRTFNVHLLCELLRGMNYHGNDAANGGLAFSEDYISKMLHSLVDCGILEVSVDKDFGNEDSGDSDGLGEGGGGGDGDGSKVGTDKASNSKNHHHHSEIFQFHSKLVSHALRETLLDSQLNNIVISPQLQIHCQSLVTLKKNVPFKC